jgi:DNA modification methylase
VASNPLALPQNPENDLPLDQVLEGDCLQVLDGLPARSVDVVFADPPYNLQLRNELWRPNQTRVNGVNDAWDHFGSFADYDEFSRAWLNACRRVLKDTGTLWVIGTYHNIFRVGAILQDLEYWILNDISWIKSNPMPNFHGVRFTNAHETLIWAQKVRGAPYTFNYAAMKALNDDLQMRSDWYLPLCTGKERLRVNGEKAHATQKPEALLYRVILASSNPGDVVLDPFMGSGTTGAVAKRLQRHWIGIERDSGYVEIARQRIQAVEQTGVSYDVYTLERRRGQPRIPFGALIERGLLLPGQSLFLGEKGTHTAQVLADGRINVGAISGSIHKVARMILQAPVNGWTQWFYDDAATGQRKPVDTLREQVRRSMVEEAE